MKAMHKRLALCAGLGTLLAAGSTAILAQAWPARPVKFVVPYEAGGGTDNVARGLVQRLTETIGGTFVIENRPGAGTILGAETVAKSPADGYTLFFTTGTAVTINQHMYRKLPYNPEKDFTPVAMIGASPYGLFAHPAVPANSLRELLAFARANPGKLNVALGGAGTPTHFALQMLELASDTRFTAVQYKGNASSLQDTLGGRVELIMGVPPLILPHVKSGKLKALAITSPQRFPQLPDVPAIAELYPGFEAQTWYGIVAPTGTARDIVERLNAEIQKYTRDPAVREKWLAQGTVLQSGPPEQMAAYIKAESERWGVLIRKLGLSLE